MIPLVVALLLVGGCGSEDASTARDGTAADGHAGSEGPAIPWLADGAPPVSPPALTPCPEGWRDVVVGGQAHCEPFPAAGRADCGAGEVHLPGSPGCERLGAPCPVDGLPADLPADVNVVYVREGATAGDGSRASPWVGPADFAWGSLPAGSIVALGRGDYEHVARLRNGVSLHGACVAETTLRSSMLTDVEGVVNVLGVGSTVQQLTIGRSERYGVVVFRDSEALLRDLAVEGVRGVALVVSSGQLVATDASIVGTRSIDGMRFGRGLNVGSGATAEIDRTVFAHNRTTAVFVQGDSSAARLTDVAIVDTRPREVDLEDGLGVHAQDGATVVVERAFVEGNHAAGLATTGGSELDARDVVVRGTLPQQADGELGRGLAVERDSVGRISRVLIADNHDHGVLGRQANVVAEDVIVRGTLPIPSDGTLGRGVGIEDGGQLELRRALVVENHAVGVVCGHAETSLTVSDLIVRGTLPRQSDSQHGRGLNLEEGCTGFAERVILDDNAELAVYVGASTFTLDDALVRETGPNQADLFGGRGIVTNEGSTSVLRRVLFDRNRDLVVAVFDPGTSSSLSSVVVRNTLERACATSTCPDAPNGTAVGAFLGGALQMTDFEVTDTPLCGVMVARDGELDVEAGLVARAGVGACVQVAGYDLERLTRDVRFVDNGVNVEVTELPVPDAEVPVAVP